MAKKKDNKNKNTSLNNEVKIRQVNPRTELNDFEKTAIFQFRFEEELSKTQKFKKLNKSEYLSNTAKLDLSDLDSSLLPAKKESKSLYQTIKIKLESIIKSKNNNLKNRDLVKVTKVISFKDADKKKLSKRDYEKKKVNIDDPNLGNCIYDLNVIGLTNLSKVDFKARKYSSLYKYKNNIKNVHVNKTHYDENYNKLNSYAIDHLYYDIAPKETTKFKLYRLFLFISSFVLVVCLAYLGNWIYEGNKVNNLKEDLKDKTEIKEVIDTSANSIKDEVNIEDIVNDDMYWKYLNTPLSSVDFSKLVLENNDTKGWIIVNNTNVDYPVVQSINNEYYLNHAYDKSKNKAGWIYADYRNNISNLDRNTVIYGHGRKDGVMFGSLVNTLNSDWYTNPNNQVIQFSTLEYDSMWQIFSIYKIEAESYYITTEFSSDTTYKVFIDTMKSRSIYDFNVDVTKDDKILTLSTCYNDYGMRLVVQAKLIKQVKKS